MLNVMTMAEQQKILFINNRGRVGDKILPVEEA
jgi:hypothetical protein